MSNVTSKLKYGVSQDEYKRIKDMWKQDRGLAIIECKLKGYKRLVQHLQQKL